MPNGANIVQKNETGHKKHDLYCWGRVFLMYSVLLSMPYALIAALPWAGVTGRSGAMTGEVAGITC